jgi:hypothetical protein
VLASYLRILLTATWVRPHQGRAQLIGTSSQISTINLYSPLRYVFLVYDSTHAFENLKKKELPSSRRHFDLKKFAKKAKFDSPIAGTFIYVSTNPDEVGTSTGFTPQETQKAVEEQHFLVEEQVIVG